MSLFVRYILTLPLPFELISGIHRRARKEERTFSRNHLVSLFSTFPLIPFYSPSGRSPRCPPSLSFSSSLSLFSSLSFLLFLRQLRRSLAGAVLNSSLLRIAVYLRFLTGKSSAMHNTANDPPRVFRESPLKIFGMQSCVRARVSCVRCKWIICCARR